MILYVFSNTFLSKVILKSYPQEKSFIIPFSHVFENNLSILYLSVYDVQKFISVQNRISFRHKKFVNRKNKFDVLKVFYSISRLNLCLIQKV